MKDKKILESTDNKLSEEKKDEIRRFLEDSFNNGKFALLIYDDKSGRTLSIVKSISSATAIGVHEVAKSKIVANAIEDNPTDILKKLMEGLGK